MASETLAALPVAPPSLGTFLEWAPLTAPVLPAAMILAMTGYLMALARVKSVGGKWPLWRTLCFLAGCLLVAATTGLALENYGYGLFSVFMFQQLTLMMAAPPLLVLGAPVGLVLRTRPRSTGARRALAMVIAAMRSRQLGWLLHPVFTIPLFLLSFYGLYLTPLADFFLATTGGHVGLEVFFLVAGLVFTVPLLSTGPLPFRMTHHGRLIDLFVEMPLHAFFGVFLMMAPRALVSAFITPPEGWGIDPVMDQAIAGGLAWSYGEGPTLVLLLIMLGRWYRNDTRKARERDLRVDAEGDAELDAYNERLRVAAERGEKR
ncbi:cytochrome c oxidase assembly protein [Amnibacterium flavum]|nr:cytochrome c oxidase assembly protein [Amnibacterium flavum]